MYIYIFLQVRMVTWPPTCMPPLRVRLREINAVDIANENPRGKDIYYCSLCLLKYGCFQSTRPLQIAVSSCFHSVWDFYHAFLSPKRWKHQKRNKNCRQDYFDQSIKNGNILFLFLCFLFLFLIMCNRIKVRSCACARVI